LKWKLELLFLHVFIRAIVPEKKANTPESPAIINKIVGIGSLKKLGLSFGPCEIAIVWLKMKNRANDKRANTECLPNLLFGINKSLIFNFYRTLTGILSSSVMLSSGLIQDFIHISLSSNSRSINPAGRSLVVKNQVIFYREKIT
jgi:hypothetical protein